MSGNDRAPGSHGRPGKQGKIGQSAPGQPPANDNPGWAIISYLIAGMLLYGGIGWLIGRWTGHSAIFLPAGMLIGLGLALALVIFRYGRS